VPVGRDFTPADVRLDHASELSTVQQRRPQRSAGRPATNGTIEAVRVTVKVGPTSRLRLAQIDRDQRGPLHQSEKL
jgi:hypothetical protein